MARRKTNEKNNQIDALKRSLRIAAEASKQRKGIQSVLKEMSEWSDIRLQFVFCELGKLLRALRKAFLVADADKATKEIQTDFAAELDDVGDDPDNV